MKKLIISFAFFLIVHCSLITEHCEAQWVWQNPLPQGNKLTSIKFINDNSGWAVGYKGSIIKTTDGGYNWVVQYNDCDSVIMDVYFVDSLTGYACSNTSMIIKTTNGGQNWILKTINGNYCSFYKIYFTNIDTGYVAGYDYGIGKGIILKTANAGGNWSIYFAEPYTNSSNYVYDFQIFNDKISYAAVGDYYFYKTINAGANWTQNQPGWGLMYLFFSDTLNGCSCGGYNYGSSNYGTIKKTTNGGINFNNLYNCIDTVFTSLCFVNSQTGYISGYIGGIRKTTNFGTNWITLNSGTSTKLNSIVFRNPDTGMTIGDDGLILMTNNGGTNWNKITKGKQNNLTTSYFINENTGFVGGDNIIIKTTNGGTNWITKLDTNLLNINSIKFFNDNTGVALGTVDYWTLQGYLVKTIDGGQNWSVSIINSNTDRGLNSLSMLNENTGYACGFTRWFYHGNPYYYGLYMKTTNGGQNWVSSEIGSEIFSKIIFFDENNGFMFSNGRKILKTTNSGVNWIDISFIHSGEYFASCYFTNLNTGWLCYYDGYPRYSYIFKTTNSGNNWQKQDSIASALFYSLCCDTNGNCWAVGLKSGYRMSSVIYSSSNGGNNWISQRSPTDFQLNNVSFANDKTGWIFGSNGTILKTTTGILSDINFVNNPLPKTFYLNQNYPNPFNPVTTIGYQITKYKFVSLKVFDLLGKEIKKLVSEKQMPGKYEVTFDGSRFASGIYFYQLRTGDFVETKKMILVK